MNRRSYSLVLFSCAALAFVGQTAFLDQKSATAATVSFAANLDGLQEVPPNASPAFGQADATLDTVSGAFALTDTPSYSDLLGTSVAVTLNDAAVGSNGPILLSLTLDNPGTTSGTFSGSGMLTAQQVTDLVGGNGYLNIRSNVFPGGEIRGQLFTVPEPATITLAASCGLAAMGLFIVRRRAKRA